MKNLKKLKVKNQNDFLWIVFLFFGISVFTACSDNQRNKLLLPNITGKPGEITVVMNDEWWKSPVGDTLKQIFEKPYPLLPQSEPSFDVYQINHEAFTNLFKRNRNIIQVLVKSYIADPKITIKDNVWANQQVLVIVEASNEESLLKLLQLHGNKIFKTFYDSELQRYARNYTKYTERGINARLLQKYRINIFVPMGFKQRKDTMNFCWFSNETNETSQGLFVYDYPYTDTSQLQLKSLLKMRDSIFRMHVQGPLPNTWMITERLISPMKKVFRQNNSYTIELRGLWRVKNDFMGGPFISYSMIDTVQSRIITADAYVYAPKFDKRNYIMQCEAFLSTISITK